LAESAEANRGQSNNVRRINSRQTPDRWPEGGKYVPGGKKAQALKCTEKKWGQEPTCKDWGITKDPSRGEKPS